MNNLPTSTNQQLFSTPKRWLGENPGKPWSVKLSRYHFVMAILLLLSQFKIGTAFDFDVPVSVLSLLFFTFWLLNLKRIRGRTILFVALLFFLILFKVFIDMNAQTYLSANYSSALLMLANGLFLVLFSTVGITKWNEDKWHTMVRFALYVIGGFIIAQFVLVFIFGFIEALFPFGEHIVYGQISEVRLLDQVGYRMPGTFIEPSFASLVMFTLVLILSLKKVQVVDMVLLAICLIAMRSVIGIIAVTGVVIYAKLLPKKLNMMIIALFVLLVAFSIWAILTYAPWRISQLWVEGTSGYYRVTFPLIVLAEMFSDFWVGIPFGSIEEYVVSFKVMNGGTIGSSLDNGLAVLFVYFGWVGVLVTALLVMILLRNAHKVSILTFSSGVFLMLMFTGGVFLFTFNLLLCLLIYSLRINLLTEQSHSLASNRHSQPLFYRRGVQFHG